MALRIRKNGDVLCAALHGKEKGDTYIPDDISEVLTGCTGKPPVLTTDPEPIHSTHGKWWWVGSETKQHHANSMTKKKLRNSFNIVLNAAERLQCENMHHKKAHQHEAGYVCPAEYEIQKHCNIIREYVKDSGL